MILSFIVVCDERNGIGKNNQLLCHLPADLRYFKQLTMGHHIVMGRKTYESIGRPLPGRTNLVISHNRDLHIEGCTVLPSVEATIAYAKSREETELMITGGATIFEQALPLANRMYITRIHHTFEADTFFPAFSSAEWKLTSSDPHQADEKNPYDYTFEIYERI